MTPAGGESGRSGGVAAITLVGLGLSLGGVRTALNLEQGLAILAERATAQRLESATP